ncbi:MAG: eukaryotic-like serine/threonine-protein kinase [Myxococcales bacterium]|nr:eukaryotic-like serine/threonine-protein kinase [Myxococcales bacterium]
MADLLPVLVADLVEESARDFLEEVARDNEEAWVPLVSAPVDTSRHLLEVYTPTSTEPLRLIAEPTGPPTEHGFPLRLSLLSEDAAEALRVPTVEHVAVGLDVTIASDLEPALHGAVEQTVGGSRPPPKIAFTRHDTPTLPRAGTARRPTPLHISDAHNAELAGDPPPNSARVRDALIGRSLAGGKLLIESLVGTGMMGAVYKALHRELRIPVAVKVLHESYQHDVDFCRRFYDEALAASRLDHPNLVRVYDFGQEPDGLLYLSMEFVAGRSLRTALAQEGPMSAKRVGDIMMQVCAGLGQAHARGIVHRDVKPDNVVLVMRQDDDGKPFEQVKVCDFGLALLRASDAANERFAGTPVYMSPEQCRGDDLDARTDVYACGIMLFELATGTVPFLSDKPIVVINRHLTMQPPTLASIRPDVDERLEPIVQKALKKVRDDRHASVRALRTDLKTLLVPLPGTFDLEHEASQVAEPTSVPSPDAPPVSARAPRSAPSLASSAPVFEAAAPAPVSARAPAPARNEVPSWLEDNKDGYSSFLTDMATGEKRAAEVSSSLARDPRTWLTKLVAERDARVLDKMLGEVEGAARLVAQRADAKVLRAVSSTIHGIATDEARHPAIRASASNVMKVFSDPALLSPIAERLLAHDDEHRDAARTLVLHAGVAGAYALYGARVKLATQAAVRAPFVSTMRALGESAWPVVRAALERIPAAALTGGHPVAAVLAEDLLLCVPALRDEAAGHLVAKYVHTTDAALCRAATLALGRLWAERAAPLLLALLDVADDGVRSAAIAGLRGIGAVDEHVVRRLLPILARKVEVGHELRVAAVTALEFVTHDARPVAVPVLVQLVRDKAQDDQTALAAARALLSVMGNEARAVIIDRSDFAAEPLKSHLLVLLRDPKLPEIDAKDLKDLI